MAGYIQPNEIDWGKWDEINEGASIIPASSVVDQVKEYMEGGGALSGPRLPWDKTRDLFAFRPGEVSLWSGYNKSGKSLVLSQIMLDMIKVEPSLVASYEMKLHLLMYRKARQAAGVENPSHEFVDRFHEWTNNRLWLYDHYGNVQSERVRQMINYAVQEIGVKHVVIDSLMKINIAMEDKHTIRQFVNDLTMLAQVHNIHIHLVAHSKKPESQSGGMVQRAGARYNVAGSSDISNQVDNIFIMSRNEQKEELIERGEADEDILAWPDAVLRLDGCRHGEWTGNINLWFDPPSQQYKESQNGPLLPFPNAREHNTFLRDKHEG